MSARTFAAPHPLKSWSTGQILFRNRRVRDHLSVDFDKEWSQSADRVKRSESWEEIALTISRRSLLAATAAAPLAAPWIAGTARAEGKQPKISHQFPGGTIDSGDFRDRMCRRFAAELAKCTIGALTAGVYPNSSLVKTVAQYSALRRGALDMSLCPLNHAGVMPFVVLMALAVVVLCFLPGIAMWLPEAVIKNVGSRTASKDRAQGRARVRTRACRAWRS